MITTRSETNICPVGSSVVATVLRFEAESASFVLQLPHNVPAVISAYEISDQEFEGMKPGSSFEALVDRVERTGEYISVVLRKRTQPIAV